MVTPFILLPQWRDVIFLALHFDLYSLLPRITFGNLHISCRRCKWGTYLLNHPSLLDQIINCVSFVSQNDFPGWSPKSLTIRKTSCHLIFSSDPFPTNFLFYYLVLSSLFFSICLFVFSLHTLFTYYCWSQYCDLNTITDLSFLIVWVICCSEKKKINSDSYFYGAAKLFILRCEIRNVQKCANKICCSWK